jgi:hypothetical protein
MDFEEPSLDRLMLRYRFRGTQRGTAKSWEHLASLRSKGTCAASVCDTTGRFWIILTAI